MRAPADPQATRGTADSRWAALQGHLVSLILIAGMAFLGWDLLQYLLNGYWDWTVAADVFGVPQTGWPGLDAFLGLLLSLHMSVFCVLAAWILGMGRKSGK